MNVGVILLSRRPERLTKPMTMPQKTNVETQE